MLLLQGFVKGVGVTAPAVKQTLATAVNPGIHLSGPKGFADAISFFDTDYPTEAPLHIVAGEEVCKHRHARLPTCLHALRVLLVE